MLCRSQNHRIVSCAVALGLAFSAPVTTLWPAEASISAQKQVLSITVSGEAWVDDAALVSEANLYTGERVHLGAKTTAMLHIPGGFALVGAGSAFRVEPGGIRIEHGKLQLRQETPSTFAIESNLFQAYIDAAPGSPARAEFVATETGVRVTSLAGIVKLTATGGAETYSVHPGESALLGDQVPQVVPANSSAGEVTRLVSPVETDRGAQQLPAALQSPVYWNDLLRSGRLGRARVTLNDGSLLSLGSDSTLRVLQHDAAAQQTVLELAAGRMRGQVMKLTRPGAKFEIRTPSAVAGLVGTDFYLYVTPDFTELIVFDGIVSLTNIATGQAVNVSAGMKLVMHKSGQTEGPTQTTPQEIAQTQSSTNVPGVKHAGFHAWGGVIVVAAEAGTVLGLTLGLPSHPSMSPVTPGSPSGGPVEKPRPTAN
jgi:hypothetical protein